ncbi:hypothetical protein [Solirubrum puertoriconensis]|uniref:hypothetical protein n=1 Tax=Solirubrum puertoriconensis TaxID=1751427 RepID=UPI00122E1A85|nr:hypothetical protein [Solirubrum puertoriconensis]
MAKYTRRPALAPLESELFHLQQHEAASTPSAGDERASKYTRSNQYERKTTPKNKIRYNVFDKNNTSLYLQVHIENISKYLNTGLFYPVNWEFDSVYKENRESRPDLLTRFPYALPLSPGIVNNFRDYEVLIELALVENEKNSLEPVDEIFLYHDALPVSRIRQIIFSRIEVAKKYIATREIYDDFFFPDRLVSVQYENLVKVSLSGKREEKGGIFNHNNYTLFIEKFNQYDRILGMLAFMKNTSLLRANHTGYLTDWDVRFTSTLALINDVGQTSSVGINSITKLFLSKDPEIVNPAHTARQYLLTEIIKHIYAGGTFSYSWARSKIAAISELVTVAEIFELLEQEGEMNYRRAIEFIRSSAPVSRPDYNLPIILLILLCKFNNKARTHTDKQAVRIYFSSELNVSENEIAASAAILGLYYGYQNLIRDDKNIDLKDVVFGAVSIHINRIKLQLERFLDRFVAESVFQYTFNDKKTLPNDFKYLRTKHDYIPRYPNVPVGYIDNKYSVLADPIISVSISHWTPFVKSLPPSVPLAHPVIQMLSIMGLSIPKELIASLLDAIPKEKQEHALKLLNAPVNKF